jgi:hypothetical protein
MAPPFKELSLILHPPYRGGEPLAHAAVLNSIAAVLILPAMVVSSVAPDGHLQTRR